MRLYSTRESTHRGEVSLLAIVETLMAVGFLVVLSVWFDPVKWFAIALCIAPLTLLRTDESMKRGLRWWKWMEEGKRYARSFGLAAFLLWLGAVVVVWREYGFALGLSAIVGGLPLAITGGFAACCFSIRAGATAITALRRPLASLGAVPQNWRRMVLSTDSATDPEYIPGDDAGPVNVFLKDIWQAEEWDRRLVALLVGPPVYIVTVAYRWAVKATCLVFLPLIWIVNTVRFAPGCVRSELRRYEKSDWRRGQVGLAFAIITALAVKVLLLMTVKDFADWWNGNGATRFLKLYVVPDHIPWWQLASGVNGVLAIGLWLYARHVLRESKNGRTSDQALIAIWRTVGTLSVILSLYTIACTVLITWKAGNLADTLRRLWSVFGGPVLPE